MFSALDNTDVVPLGSARPVILLSTSVNFPTVRSCTQETLPRPVVLATSAIGAVITGKIKRRLLRSLRDDQSMERVHGSALKPTSRSPQSGLRRFADPVLTGEIRRLEQVICVDALRLEPDTIVTLSSPAPPYKKDHERCCGHCEPDAEDHS